VQRDGPLAVGLALAEEDTAADGVSGVALVALADALTELVAGAVGETLVEPAELLVEVLAELLVEVLADPPPVQPPSARAPSASPVTRRRDGEVVVTQRVFRRRRAECRVVLRVLGTTPDADHATATQARREGAT